MGAGATPVDEVTAHVVNALLEQSTDKNLMVNVVAESPKEMPPELSKTLQVLHMTRWLELGLDMACASHFGQRSRWEKLVVMVAAFLSFRGHWCLCHGKLQRCTNCLKVHVGIPTSEFTEMHPFWVLLRERRKRWLGSVNVLCSTKRKFIWNYFDTLKERFFTGNGG